MTPIKSMVSPALLLTLLLVTGLMAQTTTTPKPPTISRSGSTTGQPSTTGNRANPCWQKAGLSQSEIQRHRQIDKDTRSQVQSVCTDSSLTEQQKHERIHQLREQSRHQTEGMMSAAQRQSIASCRGQKGEGAGGGGNGGGHRMHGGGGGADPCNESRSTRGPSATPMSDQEAEGDHN